MKNAVTEIEPLISADSDDEVNESSNFIIDNEIDPVLRVLETMSKWEQNWNLAEASKILAQDDSYDRKRELLSQALRKKMISDVRKNPDFDDVFPYEYGMMAFIRDMFDDYIVYSRGKELYQCEYTINGNDVTLGDATEVKVSYVPVGTTAEEADDISITNLGDIITLQEKAVREDGTVRVKLISPGWGSSGFYSENMLKRDGPKVFKAGTHMYMNHPTEAEARDRPERDVRDLVGTLTSDAVWESASKSNTGAGLYADARVYSQYRSFIDEAAKDIGVSIRASGTGEEGEAERKRGIIVNGLHEAFSVDYVTLPGRGGQVLSLFESAKSKHFPEKEKEPEKMGDITIDESRFKALEEAATKVESLSASLIEANTTIARLTEAQIISRAREIASSVISETKMYDITKQRLMTECVRALPIADGVLDEAKFRESVAAHVKAELEYLESVGSVSSGGTVVGMGDTTPKETTIEEAESTLKNALSEMGFSGKQLEVAIRGRN
jgi:hypothetical protein